MGRTGIVDLRGRDPRRGGGIGMHWGELRTAALRAAESRRALGRYVDRPVDPSGHSGLSHDVGTADRFAQRFRRCRRIASKSRRAVRRRHRWRWLEGGGGDWPINAWPVCNAPGVATWTKRNGRRIGLERAARAHGLLPPLSQSLLRHRRQWCGATGALGPTTAHAWKARGMGVRAAEVGWVG